MHELSFLEQADLIAYEKRELERDYLGQCALIMSSVTSRDTAEKLMKALKEAYFVGVKDSQTRTLADAAKQLEELQKMTFTARPLSSQLPIR